MKENLTRSGIKLSPVYQPTKLDDDYGKRFGNPGEYPFTRGTRAYSGQGWIQRELSGEGDARRSNEQFKYLMSLGQTGLDVIGDSPTMSLMDPDHPLARYTVGTQGVSLCCHEDYRQLLEDIPLDQMSISSSAPSMFTVAPVIQADFSDARKTAQPAMSSGRPNLPSGNQVRT